MSPLVPIVHMGNVNRNDVFATIAAVEGSLSEQGYRFSAGAAIAAANQRLATTDEQVICFGAGTTAAVRHAPSR
jgi:hypothetical protein